jgi:hypothetical protein
VSIDLLACPADDCGAKISAAPGQLAAHLIDDHGWSKVGAQAAEATLRREVTGEPARAATSSRIVRLCGICRQPGHRRETCPGISQPAAAAAASIPEAAAGVPALHLVGMLIDGLRDAARALDQTADRFDELVAQGAIQ